MTDFYLGKREQTAICPEDTYATLGTKTMTANGFIPGLNTKITPDFTTEWQEVLSAGADSREIVSFQKGIHNYPFTLEFTVTDWRFLKYANFGTVGNTGGPTYTHTFVLTNAVASFTMEWDKRSTSGGNEAITVTGCIIKKVSLKFASGTGAKEGFITATCDCVGQSISIGTSITSISANTRTAFQFRMVKYTFGGSEITEVNNGELTIDNGIDENQSRYCNSTLDMNIGEPIPKVSRYNARININYKTNAYSTAFATDATMTSTNKLEFIENASNNKMVFTFTTAVLRQVKNPTNLEGIDNADLLINMLILSPVATDTLNTY